LRLTILALSLSAYSDAATLTNYYEVLALDQKTVLCDSRVSGCAEYGEGISGFVRDVEFASLFADTGTFQAMAVQPYMMLNERTDVYVHNVIAYRDSFEGFYKYMGGQPGSSFLAEWSSSYCVEGPGVHGDPRNPKATATLSVESTLPSSGRSCLGGEAYTQAVFGQSYRMFVEMDVRYESMLGPGTADFCGGCYEDTLLAGANFSGQGRQNGNLLTGLELVPAAHAPEPSTWVMLGCGFVLLIGRRSLSRDRS
jgi:hypothetical protein